MKERLEKIRILLMDVDGVLTDGRIVIDSNGVESKFFNVKDGHGIKMIQRAGIEVGIISGRESRVVEKRASELGIPHVYQKAFDKILPYREILSKTGFDDCNVAYIGDDIIDVPLLRRVGFAAAPADAVSDVFPHVHFVSGKNGGCGVVREICDLLLKSQSAWDSIAGKYFI
jgi:3-deoxy-D-manno-octulosonate 8-phosphate phosphatase (KDO 8-P phosphatase)